MTSALRKNVVANGLRRLFFPTARSRRTSHLKPVSRSHHQAKGQAMSERTEAMWTIEACSEDAAMYLANIEDEGAQ
jgi:hypothetical protein